MRIGVLKRLVIILKHLMLKSHPVIMNIMVGYCQYNTLYHHQYHCCYHYYQYSFDNCWFFHFHFYISITIHSFER